MGQKQLAPTAKPSIAAGSNLAGIEQQSQSDARHNTLLPLRSSPSTNGNKKGAPKLASDCPKQQEESPQCVGGNRTRSLSSGPSTSAIVLAIAPIVLAVVSAEWILDVGIRAAPMASILVVFFVAVLARVGLDASGLLAKDGHDGLVFAQSPDFRRLAGPCQWHFIGHIPEDRAKEITSKQNPPFSEACYNKVRATNRQIVDYVRNRSRSGEADDCLRELERLYSGGTISFHQDRAARALIMTVEMKKKHFMELQNPTDIKLKRPGESRRSKAVRAQRKADKLYLAEREVVSAIIASQPVQTKRLSKKQREEIEKAKRRAARRCHNYRRKGLIHREKLKNYDRNQRSNQKGRSHRLVPRRVSGRRYLSKKTYVPPVAGTSYGKIARAAALREIFLRKALKSLRKSNRKAVSDISDTELGEAVGAAVDATVDAALDVQQGKVLEAENSCDCSDTDIDLSHPGAFARMGCYSRRLSNSSQGEPMPDNLAGEGGGGRAVGPVGGAGGAQDGLDGAAVGGIRVGSGGRADGPLGGAGGAQVDPSGAAVGGIRVGVADLADAGSGGLAVGEEIDIIVKTVPTGHWFSVRARRSEKIETLKEKIARTFDAPIHAQRLVFAKNQLYDIDTISDCNISAGDTVYLSMAFDASGDDDGRENGRENGREGRVRKQTKPFEMNETVRATGYAQGPAPKAKQTGKKSTRIVSSFQQLMYGDVGEAAPGVVRQKRCTFVKTPAKQKRKNDATQAAEHGALQLGKGMFPGRTPRTQKRLFKAALGQSSDTEEADMERRKANMVTDMVEMMAGQKPKERRPVMALVTKHMSKAKGEIMIGDKISKWEWQQARMHALHPGPFQPEVKITYTRQRFNMNALIDFLAYLDRNHLQDHAYGAKLHTTAAGGITQLAARSTTKDLPGILRDYNNAFNGAASSRTEDQCDKRNRRTNHFCLLKKGHRGKCSFTSRGTLSDSSLTKIINGLTKGPLKSMAGLDDEDVLKGTNSIERLKEIFDELLKAVPMAEDGIKGMKERIARVLTYHRTDFITHLERNAKQSCRCISCGLHSDDEPISCPFRSDTDPPCDACEQSFQVYSDLLTLAQRAQSKADITAEEMESFSELGHEIKKCRSNLKDWRSHIVRKKVESTFTRQQMQSLKEDEAIVVSDFKMKILPMYFRENQRKFFGKRGTACLGFMVLTNAEGKDGEVDVHFFFFFSDDTQQDSNFVLAGKSYIYSEFLPTQFPEGVTVKVRFESDGAGCFNSNLAKSCMPYWFVWTDKRVDEVQIRHSVNGDGKSSLDGVFGRLGQNLRAAVGNRVTDITDAASCLAAYQNGAGIIGATGAILTPNRERDLEHKKNAKVPRLLSSHRLVLDRANKKIMSYSNSGYGEGVPIPFSKIAAMWPSEPRKPDFIVTQQARTLQSEGSATHSTESKKIRDKRTVQSKLLAKKTEHEEKIENDVAAARANNVYRCNILRDYDGSCCRCKFLSQRALDKHKDRGNHSYPSLNLLDEAARISSLDDGILHFGSCPNRNEEYSTAQVKDGTGAGLREGAEWQDIGCYRKPGRAPAKRLNAKLKAELIRMFDEGERSDGNLKGKNKYTPDRAVKELQAMKQKSGLRMFSSTSEYGPVPTVDQIRSFWSRHKSGIAEKNAREGEDLDDITGEDIDEWRDLVLDPNAEHVGDYVPGGGAKTDSARHQVLHQKVFVLDGHFDEVSGGEERIVSAIVDAGGKVNGRIGKNTNYLLEGQGPKKKKGTAAKYTVSITNWDNLQKLLGGQISIEQLPICQPADHPPPCNGETAVEVVANKGEVELLCVDHATLNPTECVPPGSGRGVDGDEGPIKLPASAIPDALRGGKVFVLDGSFDQVPGGVASVEYIVQNVGGKMGAKVTKNTDYLVLGYKPKKKVEDVFARNEKIVVTNFSNLQKLLNGAISVDDLPFVSRSDAGAPPKKRSCHREVNVEIVDDGVEMSPSAKH